LAGFSRLANRVAFGQSKSIKPEIREKMNMDQNNKRKLSVILFIVGIFTGFIFNVFVVWANFEASLWNLAPNRDSALDGLRCPLVITQSETATITILYRNPLEREINPVIRTTISERLVSLEREESTRPEIAPGETARIEYTVKGSEAVWNRFILVRVNALPQFSLPARNGSCGIFVMNIPWISGGVIVFAVIFVSVVGVGSGLWLWRRIHNPLEGQPRVAFQAMIFLSVAVLGGILLELFSFWGLATFVLIITFLLIAAVLAFALASP
jgi:hypothetical protein